MVAPNESLCPKCGQPKMGDREDGLCPRCLLGIAATPAPSPRTPPNLPDIEELDALFPHLELVQLIGVGGMGMVYEAYQSNLTRTVALKLLPIEESRPNPEFSERFHREAKTLAQLDHPNIVDIYEQGEVDGFAYILMEHIDGDDLSRAISSGSLPEEDIYRIVESVCAALNYAHERGVVHRDIKPGNILLSKNGAVKIADFGLAKMAEEHSQHLSLTGGRDVMGTPLYMAPEQRTQSSEADHRADIYSTGVVFYEMLTGELPAGRFRPPSEFGKATPRIDEIIFKSLESEPARRYQHVSEVQTAVEAAGAEPASSRRSWLAALGVACAVALALGLYAALKPEDPVGDETIAPIVEIFPQDGHALRPSEPLENTFFGEIIHTSADVLAVSCGNGTIMQSLRKNSGRSGRAYIYKLLPDGGIGTPFIITPEVAKPDDLWGRFVAVGKSGQTLVVAAPRDTPDDPEMAKTHRGAIEIFRRNTPSGAEWTRTQRFYIEKELTAGRDDFRIYTGDGIFTVNLPYAEKRRGCALVFELKDGSWKRSQKLTVPSEFRGFGWATAISDDGDIAVSSFRFPGTGSTVHVFRQSNTDAQPWAKVAGITDQTPLELMNWFGISIESDGQQIVIGNPTDAANGLMGVGSANVYRPAVQSRWWDTPTSVALPIAEGQQPDRSGFSKHIAIRGDRLAGWSLAKPITDKAGISALTSGSGSCIVQLFRRRDDHWKLTHQIHSADTGLWLGRVLISEGGHVICGNPALADGSDTVGEVYVFKDAFEATKSGR